MAAYPMNPKKRKLRPIWVANRSDRVKCRPPEILRAMHFLDEFSEHAIPAGELSIALLDNREMTALHARFMDDPTPTDVLTFPGDGTMAFAGEICVSAEQAVEVAAASGEDLSGEFNLYLVHGWLHLAGFEDHSEGGRQTMRREERELLRILDGNGCSPHISAVEYSCPPNDLE